MLLYKDDDPPVGGWCDDGSDDDGCNFARGCVSAAIIYSVLLLALALGYGALVYFHLDPLKGDPPQWDRDKVKAGTNK